MKSWTTRNLFFHFPKHNTTGHWRFRKIPNMWKFCASNTFSTHIGQKKKMWTHYVGVCVCVHRTCERKAYMFWGVAKCITWHGILLTLACIEKGKRYIFTHRKDISKLSMQPPQKDIEWWYYMLKRVPQICGNYAFISLSLY